MRPALQSVHLRGLMGTGPASPGYDEGAYRMTRSTFYRGGGIPDQGLAAAHGEPEDGKLRVELANGGGGALCQ